MQVYQTSRFAIHLRWFSTACFKDFFPISWYCASSWCILALTPYLCITNLPKLFSHGYFSYTTPPTVSPFTSLSDYQSPKGRSLALILHVLNQFLRFKRNFAFPVLNRRVRINLPLPSISIKVRLFSQVDNALWPRASYLTTLCHIMMLVMSLCCYWY